MTQKKKRTNLYSNMIAINNIVSKMFNRVKNLFQSPSNVLTPAIGAIALLTLWKGIFRVPKGKCAVVVNRITGLALNRVYKEGTHFCVPWMHRVILCDPNTQSIEFSAFFKSMDKKPVGIDCTISFQFSDKMLPVLHKYGSIEGSNYRKVLHDLSEQVVKQATARYDAIHLASTGKNELVKDIESALVKFVETAVNVLNINITLSKELMEKLGTE